MLPQAPLDDKAIYQRTFFKQGTRSIIMETPVDDTDYFTIGVGVKFIGKSSNVLKNTHAADGRILSTEPMAFTINADDIVDAFNKYDEVEKQAAIDLAKPKIAVGRELPKLVG